jgi:alkylated DNA repair dioxygenase AlkB
VLLEALVRGHGESLLLHACFNASGALAVDLFQRSPNQVIANDYPRTDDGIHSHIDHQRCFGPVVASLSLLASAVMVFRQGHKKGPEARILLEPRSLIVLAGAARYEWYHELESTPVMKSIDLDVPRRRRASITFRTIAQQIQ